jgi:hypothetical protein
MPIRLSPTLKNQENKLPHYSDGTTRAKAGDLVVGKTYNLHGRTIVGTVLEVIQGSDSCNLRVAFVDVSSRPDATVTDGGIAYSTAYDSDVPNQKRVIKPGYDYGETKAFSLLGRADG